MKILFKTEVKRLAEIRNCLQASHKINGTMVILGDTNQEKLLKAKEKIQEAINYLADIH